MSSLTLRRVWSNRHGTVGTLHISDGDGVRMHSFVLEDPHQAHKIPGETRIPSGNYRLQWRNTGRWALRFQEHGLPGSLELLDVPGFTDVLIHWGSYTKNTEGCLLPGFATTIQDPTEPIVTGSKLATLALYKLLYAKEEKHPQYSWVIRIEDHEGR